MNKIKSALFYALPPLSLVLAAAHELRVENQGLTLVFLCLAGLFFTRQAWLRIVLPVVLGWTLITWANVTVEMLRFRMAFEQDWQRMAWIMGAVMLLVCVAMLLFTSKKARTFLYKQRQKGTPQAALFLLTTSLLALAKYKVSFPILLADRFFPGWGWFEIFLLGLYAAWIGGHALEQGKSPVVRRWTWALFSVVFFLQLGLGLAGVEKLLMTGALHLPVPALIVGGPLFRGHGFFMVILFSATLLLVGPAWCSHLCYIGAWDDALSRLSGKPPEQLPAWTKYVRILLLSVVVAVALSLRSLGVPSTTTALYAAAFGLAGVAVMFTITRKRGTMVHCTAFCPMGFLATIFGKISPWRLRITRECTGCGKCTHACRYSALTKTDLTALRPGTTCTLCGDCVPLCKHGYIHYAFPGLSSDTARTCFVVLVFSLHAVFLGVARM